MYIGRYHHLQRWTHLNNHFTGFIPWLFIQYSDCHDLSTYWCVDFFLWSHFTYIASQHMIH